jgi:hypothetical protein
VSAARQAIGVGLLVPGLLLGAVCGAPAADTTPPRGPAQKEPRATPLYVLDSRQAPVLASAPAAHLDDPKDRE